MWLWLIDWPASMLPIGQCRSISDKLPTQPFPSDRHRLAARGAPLPIPDQGGQTHLSYSGWSVCHVREWVLSLDWTGICLSGVLFQKSADGAFCGWDLDVLVLVLFSILTAFDCVLPHPRSQFLCRSEKRSSLADFCAGLVQSNHWRVCTECLNLPVRMRWKNSCGAASLNLEQAWHVLMLCPKSPDFLCGNFTCLRGQQIILHSIFIDRVL